MAKFLLYDKYFSHKNTNEQPKKAYKVLKQIIGKDTTDAQVYINLGIACQQLGKIDEAQEYFSKAKE